jgi:ketosteroid isomerase-like protein
MHQHGGRTTPAEDVSGRMSRATLLKKREVDMKYSDFKFLLIMITVFTGLISCSRENHSFNKETEKKLVEKTIHSSIGWAKNKDIKLLYSVIAQDADYIEVDPDDKIVRGFQEFRKAEGFWMSPDFKAIRYEIRDLNITFSKSGNVAWFFCMLDDINEWKGQPANWENTRWTGVLEKREGNWVIVQMHFSFPSP